MKLILCLLLAAPLAARTPEFDKRLHWVIDTLANLPAASQPNFATIAARLSLHQNAAENSKALQQILDREPIGDMFWMYPVTAIAYLDNGQLTPEVRKSMRRAWKTYMPYRGDTENHWLLYYTCLYLMSQLWPDMPGDEWYTGKSSAENFAEARDWIEGWVRLTTTRGQGEYDSPHYMGVYLLPMSFLAAWAKDPDMKKRATMMLEYLIADHAAENLNGILVGAQSRVYDRFVLDKSANVSSNFLWLWFGVGRQPPGPDGFLFYYAVASGFEPPEILRGIATDRSQPYTHYERKRTRNRWRFHDELHGPVYKTTYVRREYAVSSDQGGILQPIQQHSWDVTWAVPDAKGVHNTLFFLNPHSSIRELQTYFTFPPDGAIETVVASKKMYDSPDKLVGGSPFEKILQDEDTIIALYDVPKGQRYPHINGFFSKDLAETKEDKSGWIFVRAAETYIACRPLQPYSWRPIEAGGKRLLSPYPKNGVIVQAAAAVEFQSFAAFQQAILKLPLSFTLEPTPRVRFQSLRGKTLSFQYDVPIDRKTWPLFGGPFVDAAVDSQKLTLKYKATRRTLDFNTLAITEQ